MNYFYENRIDIFESNIPLSIYKNKHFSYRAHWHPELELVYVQQGSLYMGINNQRQQLSEGDMALIVSGDIHYFEQDDSTSEVLLVVLKPEFFGFPANWRDAYPHLPNFLPLGTFTSSQLQEIKNLLYALLEEQQTKNVYYEFFMQARATTLCACLLRYIPQMNDPVAKPNLSFSKLRTMQQLLLYIENHFTDPHLSLHTLAEAFNRDPFNLSKDFNTLTGTHLKTYINTLRVIKAEHMIMTTPLSLTDIAMSCGFNSIRTFNRTYKNLKGYPPSSIRKK